MRLLTIISLLAVIAVAAAQRGGFFETLANLFSGGGNRGNNNRQRGNFGGGGGGGGRGSGSRYPQWLDTSDGRFAKFNGPVQGIPRDHGGGRFGAANCLLCPNGS